MRNGKRHASPPGEERGGDHLGTVLITYGTPENAALAANIDRLVPVLTELRPPVWLITYCDPSLVQTPDQDRTVQLPDYRGPLVKFFLGQWNLARALGRFGRQGRPGMLFFAFGGDLSLLPVLLGRLLGYTIVMRSDGRPTTLLSRYFPGSSRLKILGFRMVEAVIYRAVHLLLTESAYMIDDNGFGPYGTRVAPLPVALERFSIVPTHDARPYDLVIAGRHCEQKGFDQLVDALPRLHRDHPGLRTLVIGDGPLRPALEQRVRQEDFGERITFLGWVSAEDLPRRLMSARMFLLPSRYEGLPNVIIEAMASGTLVLATPVGGIRGIVSDGETGFLIPACTADAIVGTVERALAEPRRQEIAERARAEIHRNHSYEAVLRQYVELFAELDRRVAAR